jgi:hypothetical protein
VGLHQLGSPSSSAVKVVTKQLVLFSNKQIERKYGPLGCFILLVFSTIVFLSQKASARAVLSSPLLQ